LQFGKARKEEAYHLSVRCQCFMVLWQDVLEQSNPSAQLESQFIQLIFCQEAEMPP
jgi:hypothetical protein